MEGKQVVTITWAESEQPCDNNTVMAIQITGDSDHCRKVMDEALAALHTAKVKYENLVGGELGTITGNAEEMEKRKAQYAPICIDLTKEEAIRFLEQHDGQSEPSACRALMLMAKGVDAANNPEADSEWTEINSDDIDNVKDGTYYDIKLWARCRVCTK